MSAYCIYFMPLGSIRTELLALALQKRALNSTENFASLRAQVEWNLNQEKFIF